jgi:Na+/proline symporter
MRTLDWIVLIAYLAFIVYIGTSKGKGSHDTKTYFLADRSLPWWVIGLSVMATQASAITFIGTTGQAYVDGLRFVQFYFGLPLAMVILCATLVPFFYRANVYTAYEYLEQRFDTKTRLLASLLFILSRGMGLGVVMYAPAIVLSIILGWDIKITVLVMAAVATFYTAIGGIRAEVWADVYQMYLIFVGIILCLLVIFFQLPPEVSLTDAVYLAGVTGHLKAVDLSTNLNNEFTLWSGLIAGTFLMLSYFGCDQSQVQRYLTGRSLRESRLSLIFNAFLKIPMQVFILFIGILLFVFYQFEKPPIAFDRRGAEKIQASAYQDEYSHLRSNYDRAFDERRQAAQEIVAARHNGDQSSLSQAKEKFRSSNAALETIRRESARLITTAGGETYNDTNYIFPTFVIQYLPAGIVGLIIAAIFAAAISSVDSELNSLTTVTIIDIYRRHVKPQADERHYLMVSRMCMAVWGALAASCGMYAGALGSVIVAVNKVGSYFYGSLLGVFVLAVGVKRATGRGAFWGLLAGMASVYVASRATDIAFLWFNLVGCGVVVVVGYLLSLTERSESGSKE